MSPAFRTPALAAAASLTIGAAVGRLLLDSMNAPDAHVLEVLAANADPPEAAPVPPSAAPDRLVIVLIDGLGEEPFGEAIQGTALGSFDWRATVDCGTPSLSRPIYHVLLTGAPPSVSGIRNNTHVGRARADDLAARVREAGGTVGWALETVPWFHDLFGAPEDAYERLGDVPLWNPITDRFDDPSPPAEGKYAKMARVLAARPKLSVLHFIGVDHAGHHRGTRSEQYRSAAREAVEAAAALREEQARSPEGARTVWMIGADHGHLPQGGHGGPEPEVRRTTWIGLWPSSPAESGTLPRPHVEVPGVVPADRLAATFAAVLNVPPPREALGEPLPLPDRPVAPSPTLATRSTAVQEAVHEADSAAHRAVLIRVAVVATGLLGLAAAFLSRGGSAKDASAKDASAKDGAQSRRERAFSLAGALFPVLGACLGFWALGPGMTLSAIGTHFGFMSRSLAAMALGAALTALLVRRWHARATGARRQASERGSTAGATSSQPPGDANKHPWGATAMWTCAFSGILPAAAHAITAGSMGSSRLPDGLLLLFPATGLLPLGVLLGLGAVSLGARAIRALHNRRKPAKDHLRNS